MNYIRLLTKKKTMTQVLEILTDYLLPHIGELNFNEKAYYLGHITLKLLLTSEGFDKPTDKDDTFEINGMKVLMEKSHAIYLLGIEIDWLNGLNNRGFSFNNPNASDTCGCGTSFSA